jgi:hypothetical protein
MKRRRRSTKESNAPKTIYFDNHGDKRLLVDNTILVVSSKTMSLISDPFKAMLSLDGAFSEAQPGNNEPIPLPEDDLNALTILLWIAHLHFNKVPARVDFEELVAVAVLTDKYQATQMVSPWLSGWVENLKDTVCKDGYEEWLWIAWEFGLADVFGRVASKLFWESKTNANGDCVTAKGKILAKNMPPEIIGNGVSQIFFSWCGPRIKLTTLLS